MIQKSLRGLALALACALPVVSQASDRAPPPSLPDPLTEQFITTGWQHDPALSPDGKHLATMASSGAGDDMYVFMMDTETLRAWIFMRPRDIERDAIYVKHRRIPISVTWLRNDLLAVNYSDMNGEARRIDGSLETTLGSGFIRMLTDDAGQPTDWVLVRRNDVDIDHDMNRINLVTHEWKHYHLDLPSGTLLREVVDRHGDVRAVQMSDTKFWSDVTRISTWYRTGEDAPWKKVEDHSITEDVFTPLLVPERPARIVVQAYNGSDHLGIWDYDIDKHSYVDLLAASKAGDIGIPAGAETPGEFHGLVVQGLKFTHVWLDARMNALQAAVDAALPESVNVLSNSQGGPVLVESYSDVDRGTVLELDPATMKMRKLLSEHPSLPASQMQHMQTLTYPSFDGKPIPAYLTVPGKAAGPMPTIVLVHGGPWLRDVWGWDTQVQVFAAHGYAVFQPQFRGTSGLGRDLEVSGYGQWGRAMQDDITAGVHYLIDHKIADPARICIVGGSYGGYAALWGLAKTPELYKCGVSLAGPSDIGELLTDDSDRNDNPIVREQQLRHIGDPKLMKSTFDSVSPLKHADRIVAPVLLVHGRQDERVPIAHSKRMLSALQDLHKDVEWLPFDYEPHGVFQTDDVRRWYGAMFSLFERTIGPGEAPLEPLPRGVAVARELSVLHGQPLRTWPMAAKVAGATAAPAAPTASTASSH